MRALHEEKMLPRPQHLHHHRHQEMSWDCCKHRAIGLLLSASSDPLEETDAIKQQNVG